jgi:PhoH-like ATPase
LAPGNKKKFVLDTNVILHDSSCLYQFKDNDVIIPITVLEELDSFKKGSGSINFHAREFVRKLDGLSGDRLFHGGVRIAEGMGRIRVMLDREFHKDLSYGLTRQSSDNHILNLAYHLFKEDPGAPVILVSKDVNLRMKAKSLGVMAQDYKTDQVKDISSVYTGHRLAEPVSFEMIDHLLEDPGGIDPAELELDHPLYPNEFLIIRNAKKSVLGYYDPEANRILRIAKTQAYGIHSRNAEQAFALSALMNEKIKLVTITGKAGTGKTLLSLAAALECRRHYLQVCLARPVIPLGNREIGYLPGDINAKLVPYMQPLYDNLAVIQNQFRSSERRYRQITTMVNEDKLKIEPLSYIRGRSLVKIFFIVDEAQNLTPHEVRTIITRAGEGTKIILTGDVFQIDHPYLDSLSNGLSNLIEKMKGQNLYAHVNLRKGERSELAELASNLL